VISQHGRPDDGTDSTGFFNAEFFVPLKPFDKWRKGLDKEALVAEMNDALQKAFPGVEFTLLAIHPGQRPGGCSGVKGENSVKVYGNDLDTLAKIADDIKNAMASVNGVADLAVSASLGQPTIRIDIDRAAPPATAWPPATSTPPCRRRSAARRGRPLRERQRPPLPYGGSAGAALSREPRGDQAHPVGVQADKGVAQVPLSELANVAIVSGAFYIYREQQERYVPVKFSVRGRDLGGAVLEAQQRVADKVQIPGGYRVEWVGEFGNLKSALHRLAIAVPVAIALILLLLYVSFGSLRDTLVAGSAIPMALTGGVLSLFILGMPFSISAAIGFVALFGIAAMNGIMVLSCYNRLVEGGMEREQALSETCTLQMRPS
jgi:cobalt-zinc-cadmium resistance protein CzcA